ncbi:MAG: sulfatase-like hydrolase/transferase [Pirellulaceae bacterium]
MRRRFSKSRVSVRWIGIFALPLVTILLPSEVFAESPATKRPNIVFILADDLGYTDVACFGSKYYETPNIDRLAAQGKRFTSGYSCGPNCQPTRAALVSGQYSPRTGVYTVGSIDRFNWQSRPLRPVDNVVKSDDLGEKHNLAAANPAKTEELHTQLVAWRKQIGAPLPTLNPLAGTAPPAVLATPR